MSWEQLRSISREARETRTDEVVRPPTACPLDGTPLDLGVNGVLGCRWCGWKDGQTQ